MKNMIVLFITSTLTTTFLVYNTYSFASEFVEQRNPSPLHHTRVTCPLNQPLRTTQAFAASSASSPHDQEFLPSDVTFEEDASDELSRASTRTATEEVLTHTLSETPSVIFFDADTHDEDQNDFLRRIDPDNNLFDRKGWHKEIMGDKHLR